LREGLVAAVAVENPSLDASSDSSVSSVSPRIPDVVGRIRNVSGDRELQVSGILRTLPYRDSTGSVRDLGAGGLAVSGRYSLRGRKDEIVFQGVWGRGISRYIAGFTGRGLDVTIDGATGKPYATQLRGAYISYGHLVRPGLRAYGTAGYSRIDNRDFEPGSAFKRGTYAAISAFREYPWGARVGSEVTWGRRVNKDGAADTALRIQAVLYYDF
jgi:hypothetical protein